MDPRHRWLHELPAGQHLGAFVLPESLDLRQELCRRDCRRVGLCQELRRRPSGWSSRQHGTQVRRARWCSGLAGVPDRQRRDIQGLQAEEPRIYGGRRRVHGALRDQRSVVLHRDAAERWEGPWQQQRWRQVWLGILRCAVPSWEQVHQWPGELRQLGYGPSEEPIGREETGWARWPVRGVLCGDGRVRGEPRRRRLHGAPVPLQGAGPLQVQRNGGVRGQGRPVAPRNVRQGGLRLQLVAHG
mmetsp:Transcript_101944/g.297296  ORF Transcript_101944/g.297296 Transcript_101944/m.297296 type:complete len:243 (+) Transcript_101944:251-979(+)